ncbi:MAG: acyl-CoA thioesterase [Candidatus Promineifilaceae bacterium]|nr:acyl-CoA thioesterase [Candidatus Promineifilaceae bacterium]
MEGKPVSQSRVTLTQVMGPGHANTLGNVHGGVIMKLCDEAGGMAAIRHARRPAVTIVVDSMAFHSPVHIGNLVTVSAEVTWTGRTSMETRVVVTAEDVITGETTHTNTAYFVYVALDEEGRPTPVPSLICETDEERERYERAAARQQYRLQQRQQGIL